MLYGLKVNKVVTSVALGVTVLISTNSFAKSVYISNNGFESGLRNWKISKPVQASSTSRKLAHSNGGGWSKVALEFNSGVNESVTLLALYKEGDSYFDDFKLKALDFKVTTASDVETQAVEQLNSNALPTDNVESALDSQLTTAPDIETQAVEQLNSSVPPSENFDLSSWNLSIPSDIDDNGKSDTISENRLNRGYIHSDFFYTKGNGAMVFKVPVSGAKTSENTKFTRVELREMLRKGNRKHATKGVGKNNWVFSSAPRKDRRAAGAVDGNLTGTVSIDHVTTTGIDKQVGRVVFAQIHAGKDEPIRFYYRKLPNNEKGSIYFAHEPLGKKDIYFEMVGSRSSSALNPEDGVALGEKFSYEIDVKGNIMTVLLLRPGKDTITEVVDMSDSGYDQGGEYMYFKAGAYIQDSTGDADDFAEVVYYELNNTH